MLSGRLDRRIRLDRASTSTNAINEIVTTWAALATVWAEYEPLQDSERYEARQIGAIATARFRIRYSATVADLSPLDRVVFEGRVFDIHAVKEIGRREGLEITAAARAE
jgi:SPP1 family predicted phage head-tail adaptor